MKDGWYDVHCSSCGKHERNYLYKVTIKLLATMCFECWLELKRRERGKSQAQKA